MSENEYPSPVPLELPAKPTKEFDELTFIRGLIARLKKLDPATRSRVMSYVNNWHTTQVTNS